MSSEMPNASPGALRSAHVGSTMVGVDMMVGKCDLILSHTMSLKRERDPVEEEPAAPAAKSPRLDCCYVVTRTDFTDDYKPRGMGWSTEGEPSVFRSRAGASAYVHEQETEYVHEYVRELWGRKEYLKYFECKVFTTPEDDDLNEEAIQADMDELLDKATTGEFVPEKVTWTVHKVVPED